MKAKVIIVVLALSFTFTHANAKGIPIIYSNGTEVSLVKELPNSSSEYALMDDDGQEYHADLGVMYKQFSLFYIPVWNYGDYKYVLYINKKVGNYDYLYADLTEDEVEYLRSEFPSIPSKPSLPFWDAYGGKLLIIGIIFVIFFIGKVTSD